MVVLRRAGTGVVVAGLLLASAVPAAAPATAPGVVDASVVVENWRRSPSALFHRTHGGGWVATGPTAGALDGRALTLTLRAGPRPGPREGVEIASNAVYGYGTFATRMRSADCTGLDRAGVVTGAFVYSDDHDDDDADGLADNHEIDIEFLCAQPQVVYMSLWTDYDEATDVPHKISRAVDLRSGQVLYNCWISSWSDDARLCRPPLPGESWPPTVRPVPGFDAAARFRVYRFERAPDRVTFWTEDDAGRPLLLWDYRGPLDRIPRKPGRFLQNVWHTATWDPFDGRARNPPVRPVSARIDRTVVPRLPGTAAGGVRAGLRNLVVGS